VRVQNLFGKEFEELCESKGALNTTAVSLAAIGRRRNRGNAVRKSFEQLASEKSGYD